MANFKALTGGVKIYDHAFVVSDKTYHFYSLSKESMRLVNFSYETGLWSHAGKIIGVSCYPAGNGVFCGYPLGVALNFAEVASSGTVITGSIDPEDTSIPYTITDLATGEEIEV